MTQIEITALEPHAYGVQTTEGALKTSHKVRVPQAMLDDLFPTGVDEERLVRESFEFLLEREPATSILDDFALDRIAEYYPGYYDEVRARLS